MVKNNEKKHKERKRGNKTGIRSIDDFTMRSYSDWEEEKTKADTAITRYIASKATFSWRGER